MGELIDIFWKKAQEDPLYMIDTNIENHGRIEHEHFYDKSVWDIKNKWFLSDITIDRIQDLGKGESIEIDIGVGLDTITVTRQFSKEDIEKGKEEPFDIPTLDKFGKKIVGTGEMSWEDIQPGGEDYEWAKEIEKDVREIERQTGRKLKFIEMQPFDKYQGPYAEVKIEEGNGKVWQVYDKTLPMNILFIEYGMGWGAQRKGLIGDVELLSAAINQEGNAREVATKNRELSWDEKLNEISLDWGDYPDIPTLDKFGQRNYKFSVGDKVVIINTDNFSTTPNLSRVLLNKESKVISLGESGGINRYKVQISRFAGPEKTTYWFDEDQLALTEEPIEIDIPTLDKFGKLSNRKATYSWSFAPEFYERLRESLVEKIENNEDFKTDLVNTLGVRGLYASGELTNQDLAELAFDQAVDIDTVTDLDSPIEVWLDEGGDLTVLVWDYDEEKEEEIDIPTLDKFG